MTVIGVWGMFSQNDLEVDVYSFTCFVVGMGWVLDNGIITCK